MRNRLFIAFILAAHIAACRVPQQGTSSNTESAAGFLNGIKPFTKMRSAAELYRFRNNLMSFTPRGNVSGAAVQPRTLLRTSLLRQINAQEGMPRVQVEDVLQNILSTSAPVCGGASCARVFGLDAKEVDSFLDETLDIVRRTEVSDASKQDIHSRLVASLLKTEPEDPTKWTIRLVPDPDSKLWRSITPETQSLAPDFPSKSGDKDLIPLTSDLSAKVRWTGKQDQQLDEWKKIFDNVDDCATRGVKKGKVYASFNDCLADATLEEKQFLSAKLVYNEIEEVLSEPATKAEARRNFRAVLDKDGNMQGLVMTKKRPSVSYYGSHYPGAVPAQAAQIPALEVAYLLAAPWNLMTNHPKKVKGVGTACLGLAALESARTPWGGRILLEASPSAVPFYKKAGFTAIGETFDEQYGSLPAMWLEPQVAEKLIPSQLKAGAAAN